MMIITKIDPRFPQINQTLNCYVNYIDYHRCVDLLEGDERCEYFKKVFTALCPFAWVEKWDKMREDGIFPHKIVRVCKPEVDETDIESKPKKK